MATPVTVDGIFEDTSIVPGMMLVSAVSIRPQYNTFQSPSTVGGFIDVAAIRPFQAPPGTGTINPDWRRPHRQIG
jgi:hypothetical protein